MPKRRNPGNSVARKIAEARLRVGVSAPTGSAHVESFVEFVSRVKPGYVWHDHCRKLASVLQDVADGKKKRVMIFMPPRHSKSETVSRLFSAYYISRFPDRFVGITSYSAELAYTLSRAAKDNFVKGGGLVRDDVGAVKHWETAQGGGMWAAGVGGAITGKGFHLGIIDDALKNAEEAASEVIRAKHKEWYGSTFYTREQPGDGWPIVIVQTRWHEDDLSGWLLSEEKSGESPEGWHVVCMEAIKEESPPELPETCTLESDERKPGDPLCEAVRPLEKLKAIAKRLGNYAFSALFQQRPTPGDGLMFSTFPVVDAVPNGLIKVRGWDKAGTDGGGDWSAGVLVGMTNAAEPEFYILDVVRGQWSSSAREKAIRDTASADGHDTLIWIEQEPGSGGKDSADLTIKGLAGFLAYKQVASGQGNKAARARPLAAQAQVGNVKLLRGDWNRDFINECKSFPNGKHDDQVDAASLAFTKLCLEPRPDAAAGAPAGDTPPIPHYGWKM